MIIELIKIIKLSKYDYYAYKQILVIIDIWKKHFKVALINLTFKMR